MREWVWVPVFVDSIGRTGPGHYSAWSVHSMGMNEFTGMGLLNLQTWAFIEYHTPLRGDLNVQGVLRLSNLTVCQKCIWNILDGVNGKLLPFRTMELCTLFFRALTHWQGHISLESTNIYTSLGCLGHLRELVSFSLHCLKSVETPVFHTSQLGQSIRLKLELVPIFLRSLADLFSANYWVG